MQKQNPFWMYKLHNFILQVLAKVPDTQDGARCRKIIHTKTYCKASKKAVEAFWNHIAAGWKKNNLCAFE